MGLTGRAYIEKNLSRARSAEMLTRLLEEMCPSCLGAGMPRK